jgi:putative MATE family efflux protein
MKDLTKDSIVNHILSMSGPIAAGMIVQMAYQLIDLYFVSGLGKASISGVGAAGNATFIVLALTQVLGVGTVALISQAVGRKDPADANLVFNQSISLSAVCALITLVGGYLFTHAYMQSVAADEATVNEGTTYLFWFMPGLALQFALVTMGSALRGTGIVQPTMFVQMLTVLINAILAPVLIAGWGTGHPLGVAGAGLASSIAIAIGVLVLWLYFRKLEHYVSFNRKQWRPLVDQWNRMLKIGLPAGGEFALLFVYMAVIFYVIRDLGAASQAGFSIGSRVMQAIFLPAMAIAFATGPIVGQNFGARNFARVRETYAKAILIESIVMGLATVIAQWRGDFLVGIFTKEADVIHVGVVFLTYISWNFIAQGVIYTSSSTFQGLGNTKPALLSSATRLVTFAIPAIWLSVRPGYVIEHIWVLSIATITLQAIVSVVLIRIEFAKRLQPMTMQPQVASA